METTEESPITSSDTPPRLIHDIVNLTEKLDSFHLSLMLAWEKRRPVIEESKQASSEPNINPKE